MAVIDHLVYAAPDLGRAIDWFEAHTGVRPAVGGAHIGMGTHNALVSFGSGYVELIAADPEQPDPAQPRPFGLDDLDGHRLVAFAVRPDEPGTIDALVATATAAGYEPGDPVAMSRLTPQGTVLEWRLTFPRPMWRGMALHGAVPFVIDWGDTPMPNTTAPGGLELVDFVIEHRDAALVGAAHHALGLEAITVRDADAPSLSARLTGSAGTVTL